MAIADRRQAVRSPGHIAIVLLAVLSLLSPSAPAAVETPHSIQVAYDIYKGGLRIGQIDETFTRDGDNYSLVSTTRAVGLLAIFRKGRIIIRSNGKITPRGLQPVHFSDRREGESDRDRDAEFDWATRKLTLIRPSERDTLDLPGDTQDRLSAMYQFMFLSLDKSGKLDFHMTNGNKLDIYHYLVKPDQQVTVPLGTFTACYVASVPEANSNRTEIWLATEHANFPYKMVITDPDGGQLIQVLTRFDLAP